MNILLVLGLLQLLAIPALTLTRTSRDYWGEFGAYGSCSRTCGTGVAKRTRKCITSRTDGGHNCIGSPNSFQTCNTQECPVGSMDFREEQCSHFDRFDFQGIYYSWVPYHGASNPCELNCLPREESFFYRQSPAVIDGTPCYGGGRTDICVQGICRMLTHEEFMGLDEDVTDLPSAGSVAPEPSETHTYVYKTGVFGECSANCSGGMQHRSVECWLQDPMNPHVVEETHCISQHLQRPHSQQACNMHPCAAEYSVSSYSVCSVTCGEGVKAREVICVGPGLEHLDDHACSGLERPPTVKACRRPACHTHITWHVTEYGLCTRSCGGGVRERRVNCFDTDLNPYPETQCGLDSRPVSVEECNTQACHGAQMVPSVQDPTPHESIIRGYVPHVTEEPSASGPQTSNAYDPHSPVNVPHCGHSFHGCCPDGLTSATGPENEGCPHDDYDCVDTRYGCCSDEVTPAQGFGRAGCPEYQAAEVHSPPSVTPPTGDVCTLPRDEGPCDTWVLRVYYDLATGKCVDFWYGSCHGNANNFASLEICHMECGHVAMEPRLPPLRGMPRRGSLMGALRARA
ncbi:papilin b, proteoglycan-like sulfated glycoprotein isoform X2 [Solea solea]|nr:papilin b, proteoglycan-like sulfated glycoprotein isoform X2 [Solea solea]